MSSQEIERQLEEMIDANSLHYILEALSRVCLEKANHLRDNWQDEPSAKSWDKAAKAIDKAWTVAYDRNI